MFGIVEYVVCCVWTVEYVVIGQSSMLCLD